jgi:tetratricopeptide (TPR) repeat protein
MGRFDESIAEIKAAIDLEPASALNQMLYGMILYYARRYDEAIAQLERTVEMDANFGTSYGWLVGSYQMKGEYDKAFDLFLRTPKMKKENPERVLLLKEIYAQSGWRGIFQRQLEETIEEGKSGQTNYGDLADLYTDLGDKEQAIAYLERDFQKGERNWGWTALKIDPRNDFLQSDPRFEDLVRRVGLK